MPLILLIETSTSACSVALAQGDVVLALQRLNEPRMQASLLVPLIQEVLLGHQRTLNQCDAVAVSAGPGSYTGLRVGVSTAKGICFGCNIPLIAIDSLQIIMQNAIDLMGADPSLSKDTLIIPLMDARRMEVYTATYSLSGERQSATQAKVIDTASFADELARSTTIFAGDGAEKCRVTLAHPNARFIPLMPSAEGMRIAACRAYQDKNFVDLAYFEPWYGKEYVAAAPTCKVLPGPR